MIKTTQTDINNTKLNILTGNAQLDMLTEVLTREQIEKRDEEGFILTESDKKKKKKIQKERDRG